MRPFHRTLAALPSLAILVAGGLVAAQATGQAGFSWSLFGPATDVSLRGLHAVSEQIVWATGANGTWVRSIDGGNTWQSGRIRGAESLGVRDIHAFDGVYAVALTIGSPGRVYRTNDGGYTWQMVYEDPRDAVFFNCMDFADARRGYAVGDAIDGRFLLIATTDGGRNWAPLSAPHRPEAEEGEAQFAASGTCLQAAGQRLWIGTGGSVSRVLRSDSGGRQWSTTATPLQQGSPSQGVFGLLFWNERDGIIVGGDYTNEDDASQSIAITHDGGDTWLTDPSWEPGGFRSAVVRGSHDGRPFLVAVGPGGTDVSWDDGRSWRGIPGPGFHVVSHAPDGSIWAAGSDGRVALLQQR
jgi:photosystem II stability/assembly factor-like uncharacterized protein